MGLLALYCSSTGPPLLHKGGGVCPFLKVIICQLFPHVQPGASRA